MFASQVIVDNERRGEARIRAPLLALLSFRLDAAGGVVSLGKIGCSIFL